VTAVITFSASLPTGRTVCPIRSAAEVLLPREVEAALTCMMATFSLSASSSSSPWYLLVALAEGTHTTPYDHRVDIWSLAVVQFELLYGELH
jgi:serine/threonine protein kinase